MSGKGGVGKTTIAVNLACSLSRKGFKVGLLDVDIHGPNAPNMLDISDEKPLSKDGKMLPIDYDKNLKVISMAFLLDKKDAVIWRGPMKHNLIKQFIEDVAWGSLDYLVVDFPPGTGDEHISMSQLLEGITGCIIVSTPQKVALADAVRSIDFSRKVNIPIIGLVENMAGDIFGRGNVEKKAKENSVDFLGSLDMERSVMESGDKGEPFVTKDSESSMSFELITDAVMSFCGSGDDKDAL